MNQPPAPALPCLCATLRRAARSLTQLYEEALRPLGLRSSQFTILQVLWRMGELSQGSLGDILAMDSTSLSRTLAIMRRHGWILERPGQDRRERLLRIAKPGEALLYRALPQWEKVQARLRGQLGDAAWESLFQLNNHLTNATAA